MTSRSPSDSLSRLDRRIREVCDAVGLFIEYWGFKAIHGRIWTLLALSKRPLSQVEVAERLEVSRSLVSGAIGELVERDLVEAQSAHRNAPYRAVIDIWPTISEVLRTREWMLIERARLAMEAAVEELEASSQQQASQQYNLTHLRFLLRMTELAQTFLKLLMGIRVPEKLEGLSEWLRGSARFMQNLRKLRSPGRR